MDRNVFLSHSDTHQNPIRYPPKYSFLYILICMADMVSHWHGTYAAQILIILLKPLTIIPEQGKVESYGAYS